MNTQKLLELTKKQIIDIKTDAKLFKTLPKYSEEAIFNILKLSKIYSRRKLSLHIDVPPSTITDMITRHKKTVQKKVEKKENVFNFIDLNEVPKVAQNNIDLKNSEKEDKKIFMTLTTPKGIIITIYN